jgi:ribosomal protein S18 acetylase RimI-like enzyme
VSSVLVRSFQPADADAVNRIALAAFAEYEDTYSDWDAVRRGVGAMSTLADAGELIVAGLAPGTLAGAVAYMPPGSAPRADFFEPEWPIIRMLVVDPAARGRGVGRTLTEECVRRAWRDGAKVIALHTSPAMEVAFALYVRMGFTLERRVPDRFGVPYGVYLKALDANNSC